MLDALGQLCRGPQAEPIIQILSADAPTWLAQLPALLTRERRDMLQREILGATRERMLREIGDALDSITAETALLLVFEDLHWVDDSTVDLVSALARRRTPGIRSRHARRRTQTPLALSRHCFPDRALNVHAQLQFSAGGFNVEIHVAFDQTDDLGDLVRGLAAHGPGQAFHFAVGE